MKYMGSKRAMLRNGLGHLLDDCAPSATRFVDLFAGSGAVAAFVAKKYPIQVLATDLQQYSVALSEAVLGRRKALNAKQIWKQWETQAVSCLPSTKIPRASKLTRAVVEECREWSSAQSGPITRAYGGHYFSPAQAIILDALRASLPSGTAGAAGLAAMIRAASKAVASPGHTAQPFQPTRTAKAFLQEAWSRQIPNLVKQCLEDVCAEHAMKIGEAHLADANKAAEAVKEGDLVFIDPPYSGVHYSRFYHVLETIARGNCGEVSGVGRYPASEFRPRSRYSIKTEAAPALDELLASISNKKATAILTFPDHDCSNGLSGPSVTEIAAKHFTVDERSVQSIFSTLGGPRDPAEKDGRAARKKTKELILVLTPKKQRAARAAKR